MEALSSEVSVADVEDVRTITRKGMVRGRVEVLGRERRRTWTAEQKRAIVAERVWPEIPAPPPPSRPDGVIEVVLPSGVLVRVDATVDGRALRRVLSALDDR